MVSFCPLRIELWDPRTPWLAVGGLIPNHLDPQKEPILKVDPRFWPLKLSWQEGVRCLNPWFGFFQPFYPAGSKLGREPYAQRIQIGEFRVESGRLAMCMFLYMYIGFCTRLCSVQGQPFAQILYDNQSGQARNCTQFQSLYRPPWTLERLSNDP